MRLVKSIRRLCNLVFGFDNIPVVEAWWQKQERVCWPILIFAFLAFPAIGSMLWFMPPNWYSAELWMTLGLLNIVLLILFAMRAWSLSQYRMWLLYKALDDKVTSQEQGD